MGVNRGKQFEEQVFKGFKRIGDCDITRLPDQMSGYKGSTNVSDFIVFNSGNLIYIECKSLYGNTLNLKKITQLDSLTEKELIPDVSAGVMVWFIDHDITLYIPVSELNRLKREGKKSINIKDIDSIKSIIIQGKKKRILFEYDLYPFLEYFMWWK